MPVGLSNVVAIAVGGSASLALRSEGKVTTWGTADSWQTISPLF